MADLTRLVRDFEAAEQATSDSRRESERDRNYYDGYQWTSAERATLEKRKQPVITVNRIKPKVDFLLGLERKQRNDPKAYPRTPSDEDSANAATDGIRYVCDDNQFDIVRSSVWKDMLVEGYGGAAIEAKPAPDGSYKITIKHVPWDRLFHGPHSRRADFTDDYRGQVIWMDYDAAKAKWPEQAAIFDTTISSESDDADTFGDRPQDRWTNPKRKRIRIVEIWYPNGEHYIYTKAGILDEKPSPYVDKDGVPEDGLEMMSCFIDADGNRYGVVRNWISQQDEINKRRSKFLHLISMRQVRYDRGAIDDPRVLRQELAKPDGEIVTNPDTHFEILPTGDMAAGQFSLLQESTAEIDNIGVNAALSGTESRQASGRAIIAKQEGGMLELGPCTDQLRQWQLRVYRKVWNRIRQYWTEEKWVRVTDDEKTPRHVGLNQKITRLQAEMERAEQNGGVPPELQQLAQMPPEQIMQMAPQMLEVVEVKNNVAELDVDIEVSEVPDTVSIQAEQFEKLAGLAQAGVQIPPEALIEASGLRNKDKILEKMGGGEEGIPPQVQQAIQQAQQQQEMAAQELAKREEAAKAQEQRMKDAAHEMEQRLLKVQHAEEVLALKQKIAELSLPGMVANAMPQPAMQ